MNLRKLVSLIGYPVLRPLSACMKVQTSNMTPDEARRIVADVYDLDRQAIAGGGRTLLSRTNSTSHLWCPSTIVSRL